jgi:hypothetical protein
VIEVSQLVGALPSSWQEFPLTGLWTVQVKVAVVDVVVPEGPDVIESASGPRAAANVGMRAAASAATSRM